MCVSKNKAFWYGDCSRPGLLYKGEGADKKLMMFHR